MFGALFPCATAVELHIRIRGKHQSHTLVQCEFCTEDCRKQVILVIVKPAILRQGQETVAMPFVPRLKFCLGAEKIKRSSAIEGVDSDTIFDGFHFHLPIPRVSARMEDERDRKSTRLNS